MIARLPEHQKPYAVIVGLDSIPGIQAARILAGRGVPVVAIASRPKHYCCRTRVCEKILFADTQSDEVVQLLERLGAGFAQPAVLVPCTDRSVLLVSRHRQELGRPYRFVLPEPDVVETLMDKVGFYAYTQQAGFRAPRTFVLDELADVEQAVHGLAFPCILKPAKRTPDWAKHSPNKVYRAQDARELAALYARCSAWARPLIVQEWIPGSDADLFSCNCYFNAGGELVASFVARKLRQWPPQMGISSLGQECRNDEVLHTAVRLFEKAGYAGLGYVEMKRDARTGEYWVLEANIGRPTVRSAIAEAGGVELLYAAYCDALGWPLPAQLLQTYQGVKWVHLHYDLRSALHYARRGELTLSEWWQSWRGRKTYALFAWRDPGPFLGDLASTLGRGLRRVWKP
jgi:D-aspartate ligase